jgi:hypothetical protein
LVIPAQVEKWFSTLQNIPVYFGLFSHKKKGHAQSELGDYLGTIIPAGYHEYRGEIPSSFANPQFTILKG